MGQSVASGKGEAVAEQTPFISIALPREQWEGLLAVVDYEKLRRQRWRQGVVFQAMHDIRVALDG